jgi:hypothetical protein
MSNLERLIYAIVGSVGIAAIALALGYVWVRAMHYPFSLSQRKMWTYYVLFILSIPILCPLFVALTRWLMPVQQSAVLSISLLATWMIVAFFIVRRMSRPGGRLSEERHRR